MSLFGHACRKFGPMNLSLKLILFYFATQVLKSFIIRYSDYENT
jgi:hypothetical protein